VGAPAEPLPPHPRLVRRRSLLAWRVRISAGLGAHDAHEADALAGGAAEVVGEPERATLVDGLDRALGRRLTAELQPALEQHAQARCADRVAERLETAVRVD